MILAISIPAAYGQEYQELGVRVMTVAENLDIPWSIAWLPDGVILFTERTGHLRVIQDDMLLEEPVLALDVAGSEGGLLGVAVDPNYNENRYIYLYYTYNEFLSNTNKIVRYVYVNGNISKDMTVIDGIPGGPTHDGGRIKFGPDGKLYITTGDAGRPDLSQDVNSLAGKILRVNPDGSVPKDNPFEGSAVYSLGHRNPQGLDWDDAGNLVITEHGPSGWMGSAHDEINVIVPGANYGWPKVIGDDTQDGLTDPIIHTGNETWAPSGATFYYSDAIPQWTGKYFVATLRGNHLNMIDFEPENGETYSSQKLFEGEFGRLRDVSVGPDGSLYILTSNMDGRGAPQPGDDKILRVLPAVASFEECILAGYHTTESRPAQCITPDGLHFEKVMPCSMVSKENPFFLATNLDSYDTGDVLLAEGCVDDSKRFTEINIIIQNPQGVTVAEESVFPGNGGEFAHGFILDESVFLVNGTYSVAVKADGVYYSTKMVTVPEFGVVISWVLGAGLLMIILFQGRLFGRYRDSKSIAKF